MCGTKVLMKEREVEFSRSKPTKNDPGRIKRIYNIQPDQSNLLDPGPMHPKRE